MRILLVGGGCRGLAFTRALTADGHAVRVVTRTEAGRAAIEDAGGECWIGTPDRIGTLRYALENVTVLVWALGTASGPVEEIAPLHGSRLRMMLEKTIDSTVRGVLYEVSGPLPAEIYDSGRAEIKLAHDLNEIPVGVIDADPGDSEAWAQSAGEALERVLAVR